MRVCAGRMKIGTVKKWPQSDGMGYVIHAMFNIVQKLDVSLVVFFRWAGQFPTVTKTVGDDMHMYKAHSST